MIEFFIFELGCSNSEKSVKMRSKQQAKLYSRGEEYARVRETGFFPVVESKATAGKP